jgi:hypothetical protein
VITENPLHAGPIYLWDRAPYVRDHRGSLPATTTREKRKSIEVEEQVTISKVGDDRAIPMHPETRRSSHNLLQPHTERERRSSRAHTSLQTERSSRATLLQTERARSSRATLLQTERKEKQSSHTATHREESYHVTMEPTLLMVC